jgi:hypothetical protein
MVNNFTNMSKKNIHLLAALTDSPPPQTSTPRA